ncbi:MAG: amino acid permease [Caulobacteraceae bacterium]
MSFITRRKPIDQVTVHDAAHRLRATLSWPHLMALGVGGIVGTGIYTLVGVGAGLAGPGVIVSFAIAGLVCACAALAYAEMATMMPAAGSAYTYSYVVLGELLAWIVGWSLILEYTVVCGAVSVGWSAHAAEFIQASGLPMPHALLAGPEAGGLINLPAVLISLAVTALLVVGTRESATVNIILVVIKVAALGVFVAIAAPAFEAAHFHPFAPNGWSRETAEGMKLGIVPAASLIFFAFYGFDTISTAAEETRRPGRDLTIGIVGSMLLCTVIYMAVAAAAIGAAPVDAFARSAAPLVYVLDALHRPFTAKIVAGAAVLALPTVIMVFMYGQSRIFFVMARDGLLPLRLATVNARTGTPIVMTVVTGVVAAAIAGFLPLSQIAELANAGTLAAFIAVATCMMILRVRDPARPRPFRTPLPWLVGPLAVAGCLYLFANLPHLTQGWFTLWNLVGLAVYLLYGRRTSRLAATGA